MKFTASQIAEILGGDIEGDADVEVYKLSKIEEGEKGSLTFLSNPKYTPYIYSTKASIAIVGKHFIPEKEYNTTLIKVDDAYQSFALLLEYYNQAKSQKSGIEEPSFIAKSAKVLEDIYIGAFAYIGNNVSIGKNAKIYPNVYIGDNVKIGDNVVLFSGAKIYSETEIGNNCVINSGAIIGADGFGFAPSKDGVYDKIPQIGNVIIEDYVDIGAVTTIDRATLGSTIIREGVKLDNQIQVAHNVEIGKNTVIAAQTGIAGSSKIGENCMIGGQVGIAGHLTIGNNVRIQAQSGIGKNIKDDEIIQGTPAFGYSDFNKSYVYFRKLPSIVATINSLEKKVKALKEKYEY
ncbi:MULTISPECIES: UDP-3-O-(3-hydroxymyristoyl)glucosamine N-acyltransferase [Flavobacteriaceae]|uniref:UDP-3-O-acylglucosamine N-acyltransferase n=2 Tax=Flavobacteriaceae TaxID=49546 RepID=A0A4Y8AVU8_9FLAO|nr:MULTISPECIES: UDP-3-O-(3-hydroxymyristoyl)glucosamine N-acyltransferase [Flavobacteriaceae]TEW76609.1 UDP-3-O-(3-hydroxymyristoyl)glucosamine N-acyltransferase [Gramella jeungdoensis]GGK51542.1 UDP-3-O-acylglucosamine N-acyltransferase [Lutibacter litoralis]